MEDGRERKKEMEAEGISEEAEEYGLKTAAMPDDENYPLARMEEFLDVGSLPGELKDKAWKMLRRRVGAFGFDGCLGHLKVKAPICVKDSVNPITMPMYSRKEG
jgi:hypothetical protein